MNSSMMFLKEYIKKITDEPRHARCLRIFDFDDTLVKTDAMVHVVDGEGATFDLSPGEFAVYDRQEGDRFDYGDFHKTLINPRTVRWMNLILHNVYAHHGPDTVVILSARSCAAPIEQYLDEAGLRGIEVIALDSADPHAKASWVNARIQRDQLSMVEFFDDSHKNVQAIRELRGTHPDVQIIARHIDRTRIASLQNT